MKRTSDGGSAVHEGILSVGLTGGIACGRTTVCGHMSRLGAFIVDMDAVAHEMLAAGGPGVKPVIEAFGETMKSPSGGIDRGALGAKVFADGDARSRLEAILHPLILAESERRIAAFARGRSGGIAITDAALLVETGGYRRYQRLVVVICDPARQLERLMRRDQLSEADARARIEAQAPLSEKTQVADYLIDTTGPKDHTERRVREVYAMLVEDQESLPDLPARPRPS